MSRSPSCAHAARTKTVARVKDPKCPPFAKTNPIYADHMKTHIYYKINLTFLFGSLWSISCCFKTSLHSWYEVFARLLFSTTNDRRVHKIRDNNSKPLQENNQRGHISLCQALNRLTVVACSSWDFSLLTLNFRMFHASVWRTFIFQRHTRHIAEKHERNKGNREKTLFKLGSQLCLLVT